MNKWILILLAWLLASPVYGAVVSDYSYEIKDKIMLRTEKGWDYVHLSFQQTPKEQPGKTSPGNESTLKIGFGVVGDLTDGQAKVDLFNSSGTLVPGGAGGEYSVMPGVYSAQFATKLQEEGVIRFKINDIKIEKASTANLMAFLHDIQTTLDVMPGNFDKEHKGLAFLSAEVFSDRWNKKGCCYNISIKLYPVGDRKNAIKEKDATNDANRYYDRFGMFDAKVVVNIDFVGMNYTFWLEKVKINPDTKNKIKVNMNAAIAGSEEGKNAPFALHFYPQGSAQKFGNKPNEKARLFGIERPYQHTIVPPGTYDVLMFRNFGAKKEWRTNIRLDYAKDTTIK
jgi:hypothetical protein